MIFILDIMLIILGSMVLHPFVAARIPALGAPLEKTFFLRPWIGFFMSGIALIMLVPTTGAIMFFGLFSFRGLITLGSIFIALLLGFIEGMSLFEKHVQPTMKGFWPKVERFYAFILPYHLQLGKGALAIGLLSILLLVF